ncbi:hypothetical protein JVT61DRAFT_2867 [Boletus reticuloceps]|uniref:Uncharacterized protein n=1 Tax=Boletus reticuloceps TaxID=495285 RepID=A0A8I2YPR5_9AGAM|nr:hypothetical protein JVT61DRAFT_2867 [Boletus reticuloceps]
MASKGAQMAIGLCWCSLDVSPSTSKNRMNDPLATCWQYIALLCVLDAIHHQTATKNEPADGQKPDPPAKRHKVNSQKEVHKAVFKAHPVKMTDCYPDSPTGSILFCSMVIPDWLVQNPSKKVTKSTLKWLEGFHAHSLENDDLLREEKVYLAELEAWIETEYVPASDEAQDITPAAS